MSDLAKCFTGAGYRDVRTYIQSGNVVFGHSGPSEGGTAALESQLETMLELTLQKQILVVGRSREQMRAIVAAAPASHGSDERRSDVIFLKHPNRTREIFDQFPPIREGVDETELGEGVTYFSRLAAQASKSRLNKIIGRPFYKEMTIRNWRTRSEEHTSELQSRGHLVCRLLLDKKT